MFYLVITIIRIISGHFFFWPNCADLQTSTTNVAFFIISGRLRKRLSEYCSGFVCRFHWFRIWTLNESQIESLKRNCSINGIQTVSLWSQEKKDVLTAIHNMYCCSISIYFINAMMPTITDRLVLCLNCYDNFYTSGAYFNYLS